MYKDDFFVSGYVIWTHKVMEWYLKSIKDDLKDQTENGWIKMWKIMKWAN